MQVGCFYVDPDKVPLRHIKRLVEIAPWYDDEQVRSLLVPVVTQTSDVSLRVLDWFVTNYTKRYRILTAGDESGFNTIATLYKHWLRHYRRKLFDPFRRRERIFFRNPDNRTTILCTTCAQANFLKWAETYGVLRQARHCLAEVEADMLVTLQAARQRKLTEEDKPRKRTELTPSPTTKCQVYIVKQDMRLDFAPSRKE